MSWSLAYAEMRMIMARIVYDFDMKLADESQRWIERQKSYALWDRSVLFHSLSMFFFGQIGASVASAGL